MATNGSATRTGTTDSPAPGGRPGGLLRKVVAACVAATVSITLVQGAAPAQAATAVQQLEQNIDALVEDFMDNTGAPGLTVAASRKGRLVFSKGYGSAMADGSTKLPMKRFHRSSIGSVSKAVVTGPAASRLIEKKGIDPQTQRLYGPDGLFGGKFDADIDTGILHHESKSSNWKKWYESITIQQLFDHESGFQDSASKSNAAKMFDVTEKELTREQYHRYFLRRGALQHEPGTYKYSNHGFGLFALIIEELSGRDFYDYVRDEYLAPMKLHNAIQPSTKNPDSCDSHNHKFAAAAPSTSVDILDFNDTHLGMAQGGFRSSAQDLARVMRNLEQTHTWDEIDRMGWGRNDKGRLGHNGSVDGGKATVLMYPEGYIASNKDLSGVQVAVAANLEVRGSDGSIGQLGKDVALEVGKSGLDAEYDLWPEVLASRSCEYVRHGVLSAEYQSVVDRAIARDHQVEWVDGYTVGGKVHFNVIFRSPASENRPTHHNMTGSSYQEKFDDYAKAGYSPDQVDSYPVGDSVRYAAIWKKNTAKVVAYHGRTGAQHQQLVDQLTADGLRPRVISVASVNGTRRYTALFEKKSIGNYEARSNLTPAEYQAKAEDNQAAGRHLRYVNAYHHAGQLRFSAIWGAKPDLARLKAKHGLTADQFTTHLKKNTSSSYRTRAVTGYEHAGGSRFAALWTK